jgi:alpha-tubulin suppressor-like RCC1 family protein
VIDMIDRRALAALTATMIIGTYLVGVGSAGAAGGSTQGTAATSSSAASAHSPSAVLSWGDNSAGELGNGTLERGAAAEPVGGLSNIVAVSAGDRFTLALESNGRVLAWGNNVFGQLGDGNTTYSALPVAVKGLRGVSAIAAGGGHSLALLSDGTVMAWGDNQAGQLGDGTKANTAVPVAVSGLSGVTAISAGSQHSMALLANGTVEAWGYNGNGQLGDGTYTNSDVPVVVPDLSGVTQISAGGLFSLAMERNGTARAWGENINGELGQGTNTTLAIDRPVKVHDLTGAVLVSAGWYHALALLGDGDVVGWGDNQEDLPEPEPVSGAASVAAGGTFNLALLPDGNVEAWGADDALDQFGDGTYTGRGPVMVQGVSGATAIAAGANHGLALVPSVGDSQTTTASAHPSIWQDVPSPNPDAPPPPTIADTSFLDVSAASATDAWAVGTTLVAAKTVAVSAHWNGASWTSVTVPTPPASPTVLMSVVDIAPGDAWAVGWAIMDGVPVTMSEHWNGTSWTLLTTPDPLRTTPRIRAIDELQAVAGTGPADVWAFGTVHTTTGFVGLLYLHWVSGSWHVVSGPSVSGPFRSAVAVSPKDIWAVGVTLTNSTTFAVHWNGTKWALVSIPQLDTQANNQNEITAISASGADNVWASGYEETFQPSEVAIPYVLHNNGSGWRLSRVPTLGGDGSRLTGITVLSGDDVWAVGQTEELDGTLLTLTEHYNGSSWSIAPSLDPGELSQFPFSVLTSATSSGHDVLAVGHQDQLGQCCGISLSLLTTHG